MMESTLMRAAKSMQGELHGIDALFRGVSTDTRTLREGELFLALHGPNFDGREFVATAATKQAVAAVVEESVDAEIAHITVGDTRIALGKLAASWRTQMPARVIAITGSNGKTTVKEMVTSCLSLSASTLATQGNLNNDIGLPLMLLRLSEAHDFGVFELGANHPNEIAYLAALAQPHVVLITNAAAAHLEGFGSIPGVARAKGEILQGALTPEIAILNRDDEFYDLWVSMANSAAILSFGMSPQADIHALEIESTIDGSEFTLVLPDTTLEISLPLAGTHNVLNACAAAAASTALGLAAEKIKEGLETVRPVSGRLQAIDGLADIHLFDDSYNANPGSVIAAAKFLAAKAGESWLILGDMAELGEDAGLLHESVGQALREAGVSRLFTTGEQSKRTAAAFGEDAVWIASIGELSETLIAALLKSIPKQGAINVLVKGSRSMQMERVVGALTRTFQGQGK